MSLEVKGKLIFKGETQQVSEKFKKREFVLELVEEINGNLYTNFAKMQLVQNKCDILDRWHEGDMVTASFNIKGNKWERDGKVNYITNLDAWKIDGAPQTYQQGTRTEQSATPPPNAGNLNAAPNFNPSPETIDDLPF